MSERVMPHDLMAERALLGAVLVDNDLLASIVPIVDVGDFYRAAHGQVYGEMLALSQKASPIDPITLRAVLEGKGLLESVGGPSYITGLTDGVPRSSHIEAYATIVSEQAKRRAIIRAANDLVSAAYDGEDAPADLVDAAGQQIFALGQQKAHGGLRPIGSWIGTTVDALMHRGASDHVALAGLPTGFDALDRLLPAGGFAPANLIIIAGRPSSGKTSLTLNIADHVAVDLQRVVAIFSLEMSGDELAVRYLAARAQVNGTRLTQGTLGDLEYERLGQALTTVTEAPIHVDDTGDIGVFEIRAKARALKRSIGLDLVMVDYLQLLQAPVESKRRGEVNRTQQVAQMSRSLKMLAKELHVPVIALSQLSRAPEGRKDKRPMLSDLRESGAIEQDADVVIFTHRDEMYGQTDKNRGLAELIVAKQRNGPVGAVEVGWIGQQTRFTNLKSPEMF